MIFQKFHKLGNIHWRDGANYKTKQEKTLVWKRCLEQERDVFKDFEKMTNDNFDIALKPTFSQTLNLYLGLQTTLF